MLYYLICEWKLLYATGHAARLAGFRVHALELRRVGGRRRVEVAHVPHQPPGPVPDALAKHREGAERVLQRVRVHAEQLRDLAEAGHRLVHALQPVDAAQNNAQA